MYTTSFSVRFRRPHALRPTVSKRDEGPERVENDARVDHAIVVQLAEVLDGRDALLVVLEVVDLHTDANILEDVIENSYAEVGMETAKVVQEHGEEVHVAVLDLPHLGERVVELADNLKGSYLSVPGTTLHVLQERTSGSSQCIFRTCFRTLSLELRFRMW